MTNEYLPGIDITLQDGGLLIADGGSTESLLVIAPCLVDGAPDEPKLVRNATEIISQGFGDFYVNAKINTIAAEWKAAQDGGNRRTYLSALKGDTNKDKFIKLQTLLFDVLADFSVDHVVLKGVYSDVNVEGLEASDYVSTIFEGELESAPGVTMKSYVASGTSAVENVTVITATNDTLVLTVGEQDVTITAPAEKYDGIDKTIQDLVDAINEELAKVTDANVKVVIEEVGTLSVLADAPFTIKEGTILEALKLATGKVAEFKTHAVGQVAVGNFAKLLGDYAQNQTLQHDSTLAYIGTTPLADVTMRGVKTHVDKLLTANNDFSPYVSVIASEVGITLPVTNGTYWTNGATHYAALVSTLVAESATTNKAIKGVKGIRYGYSLRQLNSLNQKKYVTFNLKNGSLIVVDGKTTAPDIVQGGNVMPSDYGQLSTLRITQATIDVVRAAAEPFIGEPNQMPQYNALNASIKGALESMRSIGAIQDFQFGIQAVSAKLDSVRVTLTIVPMFELRRISVDISLRPPSDLAL